MFWKIEIDKFFSEMLKMKSSGLNYNKMLE